MTAVLTYAQPVEPEEATAPLRQTLTDLDIRPFEPESVKRYKWLQLRQANLNAARDHAVTGLVGLAIFAAWLAVVHAIVNLPSWLQLIFSTALTGASVFGFHEYARGGVHLKRRAIWSVTVARVTIALPPVPRSQISAISRRRPYARFYVHTLTQGQRVIDPFLEVRLDNESYFIAVWDEHGFDCSPQD